LFALLTVIPHLVALLSAPAAAAPPARPGDLLITEMMLQPVDIADYAGEWFEVWNPTDAPLDLQGLLVRGEGGEAGFQIGDPLTIPAGGRLVFGVEADPLLNGGVAVDVVYPYVDLPLSHTVDELRLVYGAVVIDRVAWSVAEGWGSAESNQSLQLSPPAALEWSNDLPQSWCLSALGAGPISGTPGEAEVPCGDFAVDGDGDGVSPADGDCDDLDPDVFPGDGQIDGSRAPHGVANDDRNCDGVRDDGDIDDDGDGFTEVEGDCDDTTAAIRAPGEPGDGGEAGAEAADGLDNDCNGCVDDVDEDGDGWTACPSELVVDCALADSIDCAAFDLGSPAFFAAYAEGACAPAVDCAPTDGATAPCAVELPYDGVDQSCDGYDACDLDGDGFAAEACAGAPAPGWAQADAAGAPLPPDCDDADPAVSPDGDEGDPAQGGVPNGKDDDCDGLVDEPWEDRDGDGYGAEEGDCADDPSDPLAAAVNPGADEACGDGVDNDCDGFVDEACAWPLAMGGLGGGGGCAAAPVRAPGAGGGLAAIALLLGLARASRRRPC
jgi:hypothetical protein